MKYSNECMADVIQCILDNLHFKDTSRNGIYDFIPITFDIIFNDESLNLKNYSPDEIKFCLCILYYKEYISTRKTQKGDNDWKIIGITPKGYENLFKI